MRTIAVAHLKGGSAKTTTAGFLAHAFENLGHRVLLIDADPQGALQEWAQLAEWKIPVRHMPSRHLDTELAGLYAADFDTIIIDTAPRDEAGTVGSAMRAADIIVLPVKASPGEVARVKATYALAAELGVQAPIRILLNRAKAGTASPAMARAQLIHSGRVPLQAEIKDRELVNISYGGPVEPTLGFAGYTGAALELDAMLQAAGVA
jgi:chromosome partitioning protein